MGQRTDQSLNDEGRRQAEDTAKNLDKDFQILFSSPLRRAFETAEIIAKELGLSIVVAHELSERDSGNLSGLLWEEIKENTVGAVDWNVVKKGEFDFSPHNGESMENVRDRLSRFLDRVKREHLDQKVLIVTHGGILRVLHIMHKQEVPDVPNLSLHELEI